MNDTDRRLIVGLALVVALLIAVPFGTLTFTGLLSLGNQTNSTSYASPIMLLMVIASAGILFYVFKGGKN